MGFEPTRAEPIGLAVQRLNHSATSSCYTKQELDTIKIKKIIQNNKKLSHTGSLQGERRRLSPLDHIERVFIILRIRKLTDKDVTDGVREPSILWS